MATYEHKIEYAIKNFISDKIKEYIITNHVTHVEIASTSKTFFNPHDILISFIKSCIDMDEWVHSPYIDVESYLSNDIETVKIRVILKEKIAARESEIKKLRFCQDILFKEKVLKNDHIQT